MSDEINKVISKFSYPEIYAPNLGASDLYKEINKQAFHQRNPVKIMFSNLVKQITEFESKLTENEEIGGRLVSAPGIGVFHINNVSYLLPDMIIFDGINEHQKPIQLIQHHSQLSVLLTALPKLTEEPNRIGFKMAEHLKSSK